ncbi:PAS domain-containing sensor histidine kinase [Kordiimonas sp. SCSIO 12610]|uniref:PAS domain-containing sensor histidine kinase n=1 Tax=Kordiimonas sp. SCSIO 12610 TaxID=2829597 RepID=UPI00210D6AE6|nr:PAS domain-containing sensor histidine kinase [Kordiimonas sp. SCSIO 12610]UTW55419.1 PAS domain S-box protein [Kordiimonas sp. SCSIO 12610]
MPDKDSKIQQALSFAAREGWSRKPELFLEKATQFLCTLLGVKYAFVALKIKGTSTAKTIAIAADGEIIDNFDYELTGAPCENAVSFGYCECPSGVTQEFPRDTLLQEMGIESYLGFALEGRSGEARSIFAIMDDKPLQDAVVARNILKILSHRVAAIIVHLENDQLISNKIQELESFRRAMDAQAIVSIADKAGNIIYVNDIFCEISGYRRDELIGQNHRILKSGQHTPEFYQDIWKTISAGKIWQGVIQNKTKQNKPYWVKSTIVPELNENGIPVRYVSIRTDITAEYERLDKSTAANNAKQRFLTSISHEFRTPLNAAYGYLQVVQHNSALPPTAQEQLTEALKAIETLTDLTDSVVYFASGSHLKLDVRGQINICDIFKSCRDKYGTQLKARGLLLKLNCGPDLTISHHKNPISEILERYLSNAIKYCEHGGVIELKAEYIDKHKLRLSVKNDGKGLVENDNNLFEAFEKADQMAGSQSGLGLGLYIVAQTAQVIDAKVGYENNPGPGAKFWVDIQESGGSA